LAPLIIDETIKEASFCFDLFIPFLKSGIAIDEVIPSRLIAKINSKNVKPLDEFLLMNFFIKFFRKINFTGIQVIKGELIFSIN
tara:strand:- start:1873 stop:2124 length:252 start_codon:yes stop_codon:yes gene_type:complete